MTIVGIDALARTERRELLKYLCVSIAAGASATGIASEMATAAEKLWRGKGRVRHI